MSSGAGTVTPAVTVLRDAFRSFAEAAGSLERRHGELADRVAHLESQLVDAHRRLESVLDALDGGIAVADADGRLVRVNQAFARLGLGSAGERPRHDELRRLLTADEAGGAVTRIRVDGPAGTRELSARRIVTDGAGRERVLSVTDVTDIHREAEEGGRRRRLEALGRMAAELAHEVRNPLGGIRLFAEMLRDDLADHTAQREMTEQILDAASGLETTVSNLLAFAAPSRARFREVDLAVVARDACSLLGPSCALRDIVLTPPAEPRRTLRADPEAMRQLVLNLLGNAVRACEVGGRIDVRTGSVEGRPPDGAFLEVDDTGCGIAREDLPRVFDPFFSRSEGGSGLGLSIVHAIVERHHGRITLDSEPGRGTRVRVEFTEVPDA